MNKQLMEILNIIQDGLSENINDYLYESPANSICAKIITSGSCGANTNDNVLCTDCVVGYRTSEGYATQIIQVFKNI